MYYEGFSLHQKTTAIRLQNQTTELTEAAIMTGRLIRLLQELLIMPHQVIIPALPLLPEVAEAPL